VPPHWEGNVAAYGEYRFECWAERAARGMRGEKCWIGDHGLIRIRFDEAGRVDIKGFLPIRRVNDETLSVRLRCLLGIAP
jgi:hypothetical protein